MPRQLKMGVLLCLVAGFTTSGGPYQEAGVNGYIDPNTWRHNDPLAPGALLNPIFHGWATGVVEYTPADQTWSGPWNDPNKALGPATGNNYDIVSLGELSQEEILPGVLPGTITLVFGNPDEPNDVAAIRNGVGYDFAVFENGMISKLTTSMGSRQDQLLAELARVEVSSNGWDFARFPCVSLTPARTGPYGTSEMSNLHNLAGKHPNAYGVCLGTPFDLDDLAGHPDVIAGTIDLDDIRYVRIVDVPGSGDFFDDATEFLAPDTGPPLQNYPEDHPIYDQWPTRGSGGFDLEAVGILHEQQYPADINLDGVVDYCDLSLFAAAWQSHFGRENWSDRCDVAKLKDLSVDSRDFAVFAAQWGHVEQWRADFESGRAAK